MRTQDRFDLTGFDPETADLDLIVAAAHEFQVPARALGIARRADPPHDVTGAVHPLPRPAERGCHESRRGRGRTTGISARDPVPGDVQLAGDTGRHRQQSGVEDEDRDSRDRCADRDRRALSSGERVPDEVHRRAHRRFRRSVRVDEQRRGMRFAEATCDLRGQHVTGRDHLVHTVPHLLRNDGRVGKGVKQRCRDEHRRHTVFGDHPRDRRRIEQAGWREHQFGTADQAGQISYTDASKPGEDTSDIRCRGRESVHPCSTRCTRFRCVTATPFGTPVEPDV